MKFFSRALFGVPRTRLDLLPFYGRLVAILNPVIPEIATNLTSLLKQDFKYHIRKKVTILFFQRSVIKKGTVVSLLRIIIF